MTAVAALVTIPVARAVHRLTSAFLVLDAIGLVVFTMAGCDIAWQMNASLPIVIVAGMITGCAGGVLRDILCNDVPLLFRSELYASVSVVTGLFYATAFGLKVNDELWTVLTFVLGISFRLLAIRYKWEMPKFDVRPGQGGRQRTSSATAHRRAAISGRPRWRGYRRRPSSRWS